MVGYKSKLDPDTQISAEEKIAAHLLDTGYVKNEEAAGDAGREILLQVLTEFRPDLVE